MSGLIRSKLSFANVVSCIALFVALGGSSYAALRVGTKQIVNGGVTSEDLRNNDVAGRDIRKSTVRGTDVRDNDLQGRDVRQNTLEGADVLESSLGTVPSATSAEQATDAQTLGGKLPAAFLGSDKLVTTGLVKAAHGETKPIVSSGPFTWKLACTEAAGGDTEAVVTVESTEADSFAADFAAGGQPVSPGSPATVFTTTSAQPGYTIGFPLSAVAPSGAAPTGLAFVGVRVGGSDCLVNGVYWP